MSAAVFHVNLPFGSKNVRLVPLCELEVIALPVWAEPAGSVNPLRRYGKLLISVLPLAAISDATNQGGNQRCGNESQLTCSAIAHIYKKLIIYYLGTDQNSASSWNYKVKPTHSNFLF